MELVGKRFGRLVVVEYLGSVRTGPKSYRKNFKCACDCGNIVTVSKSHLTSGHTKSCGCLRAEMRVTHGQSDSHLYHIITKTLAEWSRETGLNYRTLHNRLFRSRWPIEKAFGKELKVS